MKNIILGTLAAVLVAACATAAQTPAGPTYRLRPVYNVEQAVQCGRDGGKASMVADLDSDGIPTTEFAPYCLVPVK